MRERHPLNAPGDFYVERGCCLSCGVWENEAAGLMAWDDNEYPQCFVARQPARPEEIDQMVRAISVQELDCIRYCGSEPAIVSKLITAQEARNCDRQDIVEQQRAAERPIGIRSWWMSLFGR